MDETILVEKAKNGDKAALSQLVNAYSGRIYNLALRILRNKEDAEDILQETFLTVVEKLHTFDGRSGFFTWIYRIATNASLMKLRKKKLVFKDLGNDEEVKTKINEAVNKLSDIYRSVFVLRDIESLSIKETSEILNITEENVKIRLRRARQFLRDILSEYFEERVVNK